MRWENESLAKKVFLGVVVVHPPPHDAKPNFFDGVAWMMMYRGLFLISLCNKENIIL